MLSLPEFELGDGWDWRLSMVCRVGLDCMSQSPSGDFGLTWPALVRGRLCDGRRDDENDGCQGRRTRDLMDVKRRTGGSGWCWECLHGWEEDIILERRDDLVNKNFSEEIFYIE